MIRLKKRLDRLSNELYHRFTGNFLFEPEEGYGNQSADPENKREREQQKLKHAFLVANLSNDYSSGTSLEEYFQQNHFQFDVPETTEWFIGDRLYGLLKSKIEAGSKLLKDYDVRINFGIKTGYNAAFIIDETKKNELISQDSGNAEIIKPILRGRDLRKYSYDFEKPKIIWGKISDKPKFAYDEDGYYAEATTFLMTGEKLKFLLAILNSRLSEWYFNLIGTTTGMGTNRWKKYKIEILPIKEPSADEAQKVEALVDRIIHTTKQDPSADTTALEQEIDRLVYALYGLTEEEIQMIEQPGKQVL